MEEIIHPGALETKSQLEEDLGEMKSQLSKQVARVRELRVKKVEQPGMGVVVLLLLRLILTLGFFVFSRRILWGRRSGSPQHRCDDRRLDGSNGLHEVHCRTLHGFKEIKVHFRHLVRSARRN